MHVNVLIIVKNKKYIILLCRGWNRCRADGSDGILIPCALTEAVSFGGIVVTFINDDLLYILFNLDMELYEVS